LKSYPIDIIREFDHHLENLVGSGRISDRMFHHDFKIGRRVQRTKNISKENSKDSFMEKKGNRMSII
jgi:hypothetical protein